MYGLIQHGHAHTHVANTFLSIMVQHIQSPHARDEIKLIKYATHFRDGHAPTPNYTNHHSTVVPAPIARPAHDDYGGSAVGGRVVCALRAGGQVDGWVGQRQVARAHAIPQGGKSRVRGGRVRTQSALRLSLLTMTS